MAKVLQFPITRRRVARVPIGQPVAMVHENSTVVTCFGINLSSGGMQLTCDRLTADALLVYGRHGIIGHAPHVYTHFMLPLATGLVKVDVGCRLVYACDRDDGRVLLGVEFVELREECRRHIEVFLAEAARFS